MRILRLEQQPYQWSGPQGIIDGATSATLDIVNFDPTTDAGAYSVTVKFGTNCQTTCSIDLTTSGNCKADLSVDKIASDQTPDIGEVISFSILVTNEGPLGATNVEIMDEIPSGYDMITLTDGIGVYNSSDHKITWNIASIPATAGSNTVTLSYTARVLEASGVDAYCNIAQITASDQDDPDSDPERDETEDEDGDGDGFDDDEDKEVICPNPSISITPGTVSVCIGMGGVLSVTDKSGGTGNCTVSWWRSTNNVDFINTGVTGDSYIIPDDLAEGTYYYKVTYHCDGDFCGEGESDVTTVVVGPAPSISVESFIMGVDYATSEDCDHFDILMEVEVCNTGQVDARFLDLDVDLVSASNGIFVGNAQILGIVEGEELIPDPSLNDDFDGENDTNVFKDGDITLEAGSCIRVRIRFEVDPGQADSPQLASEARFLSRAQAGGTVDGNGCLSDPQETFVELGDCWDRAPHVGANDNIYVTVSEDCTALITPDMILENHAFDCDRFYFPLGGFYRLRVLYPGESEPREPSPTVVVDANDFPNGMVIIYVEVLGRVCYPLWGKVTLEDKRKPYFECGPEEIYSIQREIQVQTAEGQLGENGHELINFSHYSCFQDERGVPDDCPQPYDVVEFYVSEPDVFTFEVWAPEAEEEEDELLLALYQGDFDPDQPCSNIMGQSSAVSQYGVLEEGQSPNGRIRIAYALFPGKKYSLLVAQDDCPDDKDEYKLYAFSDQGAVLLQEDLTGTTFDDPEELQVERALFCNDVDFILDNSDYTPNPVAHDNCDDNLEVWFHDNLIQAGDCGTICIERTWYAKDAMGNLAEPCIQKIYFKRPTLEDVQKPPTTVPIECDEIGPELLDEDGHPKPEIAGYPFIVTAFGIADFKQAICNIGADYRDISVIDVCANTQKIVRQWIILDWCDIGGQWELNNSTRINWRQILKVGDFTVPSLNVDGTGAFIPDGSSNCTGALRLAEVTISDNCSTDVTISATVYKNRWKF